MTPLPGFKHSFFMPCPLKTESLSSGLSSVFKAAILFSYGLGSTCTSNIDHNKIGWDRELARTICTEFFSVRRAPRSLLFIYYAGVRRAAADKCKMMLSLHVTRLSGHSVKMKTSHGSPCCCPPIYPPPLKVRSRQTYGSHSSLPLSFRCPSHVDNWRFTTAPSGAFGFLSDYSKFGAC